MATHRVPQDVEAEDKLVGFLSLKQFIFVVVGLGFGYLTFFFFTQVHPIASLIWLPPTAIALILGLYQRKDQPVEVYLASALRFYLKPRKRKWDQEGFVERVMITAPPQIERNYTKNFTGQEALTRLNSLSHLMDTRGWASKQSVDWQNPQLATAAAADRIVSPSALIPSGINIQQYTQPVDVMDEETSLAAANMSAQISITEDAERKRRAELIQNARQNSTPAPDQPVANSPKVEIYPTHIRQHVVNPLSKPDPEVQPVSDSNKLEYTQEATTHTVEPETPVKSAPKKPRTIDESVEISLR